MLIASPTLPSFPGSSLELERGPWERGLTERSGTKESLEFEWNFRSFKWNGSSRWNVFGRRVIDEVPGNFFRICPDVH